MPLVDWNQQCYFFVIILLFFYFLEVLSDFKRGRFR